MTGRRRQEGSTSAEVAVIIPVIIMFLLFLLGIARIVLAKQAVESAAGQAARAASLARTAGEAWSGAHDQAETAMANDHLRCASTTVDVDTSQFVTPLGTRAEAIVTVTCVVDLGDVSGITGLPGSLTVTKTANSPIDTYRGRKP